MMLQNILLCIRDCNGYVNYPSPWYWIRKAWKIYCLRTKILSSKIVTPVSDKRKNRQNTERYILHLQVESYLNLCNHFYWYYVISCIFKLKISNISFIDNIGIICNGILKYWYAGVKQNSKLIGGNFYLEIFVDKYKKQKFVLQEYLK